MSQILFIIFYYSNLKNTQLNQILWQPFYRMGNILKLAQFDDFFSLKCSQSWTNMLLSVRWAVWNVISVAGHFIFTPRSCKATDKKVATWEIIFCEKGLVTIDNSGRGTRELKYPRIIVPARQRCNPFIIHIHKHLDLSNSSGSQSNEYESNLYEAAWAKHWTTQSVWDR